MTIGQVSGSAPQDYQVKRVSDGDEPVQSAKGISKAEIKVEAVKADENQIQHGEFSEEWMKKSVDQANKALIQHNRFIERDVHPVTHTVMYKIMDTNTKEVIAEYPPKKIQDMVAKMWELAGLFVDEKA